MLVVIGLRWVLSRGAIWAWGVWAEVAGGRQGAPGFDPGRLRSAREAAQLTQGALASAAGVHVNEIVEWEAGRRVPQVQTVAVLARALQLDPVALLDVDRDRELTLQQLRVAAGLSQQQAAANAGLLRTTYSLLERGETQTLSPADAAGIAAALGVAEDAVRAGHAASLAKHLAQRPPGNGRSRRPASAS